MNYAPSAANDAMTSAIPAEKGLAKRAFMDDFAGARDITRASIVGELVFGKTVYPLRRAVEGRFRPASDDQRSTFYVDAFGSEFLGYGSNMDEAAHDWREQVHCRFQELVAKRPFEMSAAEKTTWQRLKTVIDVAVYRNTTPLTVRQIGKVAARARPRPEFIEWEDGQKDRVRLERMPAEFAAYKPGQPFEAVVERDPVDFRLRKILYVRRISSSPRLSTNDIECLLQSFATTKSLPEADWK